MKAIRYHGEARLELVHEVNYYTAVSRQLGERFDKAIQSAAIRAAEYPDLWIAVLLRNAKGAPQEVPLLCGLHGKRGRNTHPRHRPVQSKTRLLAQAKE